MPPAAPSTPTSAASRRSVALALATTPGSQLTRARWRLQAGRQAQQGGLGNGQQHQGGIASAVLSQQLAAHFPLSARLTRSCSSGPTEAQISSRLRYCFSEEGRPSAGGPLRLCPSVVQGWPPWALAPASAGASNGLRTGVEEAAEKQCSVSAGLQVTPKKRKRGASPRAGRPWRQVRCAGSSSWCRCCSVHLLSHHPAALLKALVGLGGAAAALGHPQPRLQLSQHGCGSERV